MEGMKELTKDIDRAQVAGIGFGGQMHGLVTLDKDDNVILSLIHILESRRIWKPFPRKQVSGTEISWSR